MKAINRYILALVALASPCLAFSQINLDNQIKQLPLIYSDYIGNYTHDFTTYQGAANVMNLNTTGRVLDKWNVSISINSTGALLSSTANNNSLYSYPNLTTSGIIPTLFSGEPKAEMYYQLLNETTGTPLFHPFTGATIGTKLPVLDGVDLGGFGASAAAIPKLSLGVGFGTEISGMYLPGIAKSAMKSKEGDISIESDNQLILGLKHDIFYWIPALHQKNYFLTLGVSYFNMDLSVGGLSNKFKDSNIDGAYFKAAFDLKGMAYNSKATGFDLMATKSFGWVDLTLFGIYSKSESSIKSDGTITMKYASEFYSSTPVLKTVVLDNLIDVKTSLNQFSYGAALQFNIMRLRLGMKYGYNKESYGTVSLGFVIGKKATSESK